MNSNNQNQHVKDLIENIIDSYNVRLKIVKNIIANTHKTLEEFRIKREDLSSRLEDALAKTENLRRKDFDAMMGEVLALQAEREENIKKMLDEFQKQEEHIIKKLKDLSQKKEDIRIKDFKKILASIKNTQEVKEKNVSEKIGSEIERMRQEVSEMLSGFKKEREKLSLLWQKKK